MNEKTRHLENVSLFRACSPREIGYLAKLADETHASAGTVLARKGEPGQQFFVISNGTVSVVLPDGPVELGPGEFFGEMALLDNEPRIADVIATTDLDLIVLGRREFTSALGEIPSLSRSVMKVLAQRLRDAEQGYTH